MSIVSDTERFLMVSAELLNVEFVVGRRRLAPRTISLFYGILREAMRRSFNFTACPNHTQQVKGESMSVQRLSA